MSMNSGKKALIIFDKFCRVAVFLLFTVLMGLLCFFSFRWTLINYMEESREYNDIFIPPLVDRMKANIGFCIVFVLCLTLLSYMVERLLKGKAFPLWLSIAFAAGISILCRITDLQLMATGRADSEYIIVIARQFLNGDHDAFIVRDSEHFNAYLANYPQQTTLVWFYTILISLFKSANVETVFHFVGGICAGIFAFFGERTVNLLWKRAGVSLVFIILVYGCVPLYFYAGYGYGEIVSAGLAMPMLFLTIKSIKERKVTFLRCLIIFLTGSVSAGIRTNISILFIALAIVVFVVSLMNLKTRKGLLILIPVILICCVFMNAFLRGVVYGKYPKGPVMPAISWVNIGVHYGGGFGIGGYDGMIMTVYEDCDYDPVVFKKKCTEMVSDQIRLFLQDKEKGKAFFFEKYRWQWIDPTFQCFVHTENNPPGYPKGIVYEIKYGKYREIVFTFMDRYQSLIYLLALIAMGGLIIKKPGFEEYVWPIFLIGGFLFSLLWEAKPRYCLQYFLYMLPFCAYGVWTVREAVKFFCLKIKSFFMKRNA